MFLFWHDLISYTIGLNFPTTLVRHAVIWPRAHTSTVFAGSPNTLPPDLDVG